MSSWSSILGRGVLAGGVGSLALTAATYVDVLARGRSSSEVPQRTVRAGADAVRSAGAAGEMVGDRLDEHAEAVGALGGAAAGLAAGVVASALHAGGVRFSRLGGAVVTGGVAAVAGNLPAVVAGTTDPREWSTLDWAADAVPHLAFGLAAYETVRRTAPEPAKALVPAPRRRVRLLARSFALGLAAGSRSTLGLAGAAWSGDSSGTGGGRTLTALLVAGELTADKLPAAPSRLEPSGLLPRVGTASIGATTLAARGHAYTDLPLLAGVAGSLLGAHAGSRWRERSPWSPTVSALAEDAVALGLTAWVVRSAR